MAKPKWGSKRTCQSCAAKYYDLGRTPIICPKCGTVFQAVTLLKSRRNRAPVASRSHRLAPAKIEDAGIKKKAAAIDTDATKPAATGGDSPDPKAEDTAKPNADQVKAAKAEGPKGEAEG